MQHTSSPDSLELKVTDFGPIVEAELDLRPLTVFVGPSNTGKSYLAILVYALHWHFGRGFRRRWMIEENLELSPQTVDALAQFAKSTAEEMRSRLFDGRAILRGGITNAIRSVFNSHGAQLVNEISRCFGMDGVGSLVRHGNRNHASVVIRRPFRDDNPASEHRLLLGTRTTEYTVTIPQDINIQIDRRDEIAFDLGRWGRHRDPDSDSAIPERAWRIQELLRGLTEHTLPYLVGPLRLATFYLPADRTGVMHAHRAVVSATLEGVSHTALRRATPMPMLSGVLTDFLRQLIELDRPSYRRRRSRQELAEHIERALLGGYVLVSPSEVTGYPHFTYRPSGWKNALPLMNASSMVSELAPVVLYLRHIVQPNNVLIIEEPESHLHPSMQVEFTRQLALLVRAGIRVIITTHSEWVLEELANIVRRSALPEAERKRTDATSVALRPDEVGAWLFKPKRRPRGSVVEEVKLDEETGLYPTDYDAVSEALYNESASIFNRIQDSKTQ